jgi:glycerol-3-phosphate dehydrogenase subunit C
VPAIIVEKEACCGMPKLELGDLDAVARNKDINIPRWPCWPRGLCDS